MRVRVRVRVQVPVCAPPSTAADDDTAGPSTGTVYNLTIKSLKPPLALALAASPTATIGDLKARLAEQYPGQAPAAGAQRWILKGKAMGDNKLLKEFAVAPNDTVVNLMITKAAPPPASARSPAAAAAAAADPEDVAAPRAPPSPKSPTNIPELTLSEPDPVTGHARRSSVSLTKFDDLVDRLPLSSSPTQAEHPSGESSSLLAGVAATDFWLDIRRVCEEKFGPSDPSTEASTADEASKNRNHADAQKVWEAMFAGARDWISPSQKALIREQVGYSAMGGC